MIESSDIPGEAIEYAEVQWLAEGRPDVRSSTWSFVSYSPPIFARYFKVPHPFQLPGIPYRDVSWQEVADALGILLTPFTTLAELLLVQEESPELSEIHTSPESIPSEGLSDRLIDTFRTQSRDERCFVGFDGTWSGVLGRLTARSVFQLAFARCIFSKVRFDAVQRFPVFPTLWWPVERDWLFISPTDVHFSLLGCQEILADRLRSLGVELLEIIPADQLVAE